MIKRIELIIQSQNLTPSQFADRIGIQRSGLSHILSGRNNPSLDFVQKVLAAFPDLNPNWFLQGKGRMYDNLADSEQIVVASSKSIFSGGQTSAFEPLAAAGDILGIGGKSEPEEIQPKSGPVTKMEESSEKDEKGMEYREDEGERNENGWKTLGQKPKIRRILLFYEDGTFEEYSKQ